MAASSPAWKLKVCSDALQARPIDLSTLAQETGAQFASVELVEMAAKCLNEVTREMEKDESKDSSAAATSPSSEVNQKEKDMSTSQRENSEALEVSAEEQTPCDQSAETGVATQESKSNDVDRYGQAATRCLSITSEGKARGFM